MEGTKIGVKHRLLAVLSLLALICGLSLAVLATPATAWAETQTSGGIAWEVVDGTLTISAAENPEGEYGKGTMPDYSWSSESQPPWYSNASNITKIVVSEGVTSIGEYFGLGCSKATTLSIPASVTEIGFEAFSGMTSLATISVNEGSKYFKLDDSGVLYTYDGTTLVHCPTSVEGSYTIASGTTTIDADAFTSSKITGVTIPASVTAIKDNAFQNATALTSVNVPSSVTTYGTYIFSGCTSLANVTLNNADAVAATGILRWCSSLTSEGLILPDGYTEIGVNAFQGCTALTTFTIPGSVTTVGDHAFDGSGLTSLDIPDTVTSFGYEAVSYCSDLKTLTVGAGLTSVPMCFSDSSLTTVTINGSPTDIPSYCFVGTQLTDFTIPDSVTSIGERAFKGVTTLTKIVILDSVTSVGARAFENCTGLTSVTIGKGVTSITDLPFNDASSVTTLSIDTGCASLGDWGFDSGESSTLTDITIGSNVTEMPTSMLINQQKLLNLTFEDRTSALTIGYYSLSGLTSIKSITLPACDLVIVSNAFSNDSALVALDLSQAKSVKFSQNDSETAGNQAFTNFASGSVIYVSDSDVATGVAGTFSSGNTNSAIAATDGGTFAEDAAFESGKLTEPVKTNFAFDGWYESDEFTGEAVTAANAGTTYYAKWKLASISDYDYDSNNDGTKDSWNVSADSSSAVYAYVDTNDDNSSYTLVVNGTGAMKDFSYTSDTDNDIPWYGYRSLITGISLNGELTNIGAIAFYNLYNATGAVSLPDTVTTIGRYAFASSSVSSDLVLGENVKSLGNSAFRGTDITSVSFKNPDCTLGEWSFCSCYSLASVTLPTNLKTVPYRAFLNCYPLTTINLGDVTTLGESAFQGCALTSVTANSVETIGDYAFAGTQLTSVSFPKATTLGGRSFGGTTTLKSIEVPLVQTIGTSAFEGCTGLETMKVGNALESIGDYAFKYCSALTGIDLTSVTSIGTEAFIGCSSLVNVTSTTSLTSLGVSAFRDCGKLATVLDLSGLSAIPDLAFYCCKSLTNVTFGSETTSIGTDAFNEADLTGFVYLPNVTSVSGAAFFGCNNISGIYFGSLTTALPSWNFNNSSIVIYVPSAEQVSMVSNAWGNNKGSIAVVDGGTFNGGSVESGAFATFSKTYYDFGGWYSDASSETAVTAPAGNGAIYYAKWNKNYWYDISEFRSEGRYTYPTADPTGVTNTVFVGWYTDATCSTPIDKEMKAGTAYAKFMKISNDEVGTYDALINFMGGALRLENADGTKPSEGTYDMRLGYNIVLPDGLTLDSWYWTVANTSTANSMTVKGVNSINASEYSSSLSGVISNVVLTGITDPSITYSSQITITFTTADDTSVTVQESDARKRSVSGITTALASA